MKRRLPDGKKRGHLIYCRRVRAAIAVGNRRLECFKPFASAAEPARPRAWHTRSMLAIACPNTTILTPSSKEGVSASICARGRGVHRPARERFRDSPGQRRTAPPCGAGLHRHRAYQCRRLLPPSSWPRLPIPILGRFRGSGPNCRLRSWPPGWGLRQAQPAAEESRS